MASLNTAARELVLKIVYYGPGLGGKTTTLQALHDAAPPEKRGKLVSLATPVDRTLYFDFLPLRLPPVRGLAVRLQLFTVPGQVYFNATRRLVLSGADGIVFVADSQSERLDANLESLENLRENLHEHGRELTSLPHVFAYNKRDLPGVLSIEELDRQLDAHGAPSFGTVATLGQGVSETLEEITRRVMIAYEAQLPEPSVSDHAVAVEDVPPSVRISRPEPSAPSETRPPPRAAENGKSEDEVQTSAAPVSAPAPEDDVVSSALADGTYLADVDRIEASASQPPKEAEPESVAGTDWERQLDPHRHPDRRLLTFSPLFAPGERALIEQIEEAIAHGDYADALGMCDAAITRILASIAALVSAADGPTNDGASPHDATLALLLGLDGRRYLAFRALARRARTVGDVGVRDALESYAFVLEARVAAGQWDAVRSAVGATSHPPPSRSSLAPPSSGVPPLPRGSIAPPRAD